MRFLVGILVAAYFGLSFSQQHSDSVEPKKPLPIRTKKQSATEQRGAEKSPLYIRGEVTAKRPEAETAAETRERKEKLLSDEKLIEFTGRTTLFTGLMVLVGIFQLGLFWWQLRLMRHATAIAGKAAESARDSADAAVRSTMPVLFPYITNMAGLHPLSPVLTNIEHSARILIAFDNYGKTPAIIREFRGALYLTESDSLPVGIATENLPTHPYNVVIPGDFRGKDLITGALDFVHPILFSPAELNELLADANPGTRYRRMSLIGQVIYDDLFGNRHTRRFCVKMRLMPRISVRKTSKNLPAGRELQFYKRGIELGAFQIGHGASEYNRISTEKIPNPDPLA